MLSLPLLLLGSSSCSSTHARIAPHARSMDSIYYAPTVRLSVDAYAQTHARRTRASCTCARPPRILASAPS
jgi:hypothetical protein